VAEKKKIGVIGLGSMGYGIATSIRKAGHEVWGFDVAPAQVEKFIAAGGKSGVPADEAEQFDIAIVVVLNASQTETVLFGEGGFVPKMQPGAVVISCATVAPQFARVLAECCSQYDVLYLDAPISGGSVKAAEGRLSVMASGSSASFQAANPALNAMAETVFELGDEVGAGSAMKAVNQLLAGIHIASMAEALTFGMTQGIAPEKIVEVISQCAGTSWMFENRAPHVVTGDYTPHSAIDIWPKDLGIVLDVAREAKFAAPLTAAAMQQFLAASGSGLGSEDDAAVAKVYAKNSNVVLPERK
jgi:putative dehydrogenase